MLHMPRTNLPTQKNKFEFVKCHDQNFYSKRNKDIFVKKLNNP